VLQHFSHKFSHTAVEDNDFDSQLMLQIRNNVTNWKLDDRFFF
jgi:hypothetical protein